MTWLRRRRLWCKKRGFGALSTCWARRWWTSPMRLCSRRPLETARAGTVCATARMSCSPPLTRASGRCSTRRRSLRSRERGLCCSKKRSAVCWWRTRRQERPICSPTTRGSVCLEKCRYSRWCMSLREMACLMCRACQRPPMRCFLSCRRATIRSRRRLPTPRCFCPT